MNIELPSDAEAWVRRGIAEGRFASPEDAIRFAIDQAKLDELRQMLAASEEEGGEYSLDEVRAFVHEQLARAE
jgi:Arc/MetJ-type ribon-helix-helix transcriptional regulator